MRTHGRIATYVRGGCRCDECRRVARDRARRLRARRRRAAGHDAVPCPMCDEWFKDERAAHVHEAAVHG